MRLHVVFIALFAATGIASVCLCSNKAKASDDSDLWRDVSAMFQQHCQKCHGSEDRDGGLRLTGRDHLLIRNDSGEPAIIAGNSSESELIRRVLATGDAQMPPEGEGTKLTGSQIKVLKAWIDNGAVWPKKASKDKVHWAYARPVQATVPHSDDIAWGNNPIDAFVLSRMKLTDERLRPSPPAEPARLLRRVYLDLVGLPPSPEEVEQFVNDSSPAAFERVIDRLLASPAYGEKWARSWLDAARYADSNGFQADQLRSMWLFRDWVIQAINNDMPFDQFTIEQIAGDLIPEASVDQKIATGFHRCTTCNVEAGVDPEENRINQIFDRVNTTGVVWLGTTFECAQCHNHKYDPFSQQDYYQIFAYFNNTSLEVEQEGKSATFNFYGPKLKVPLTASEQNQRAELKERRAELSKAVDQRHEESLAQNKVWEAETIAALNRGEAVDAPDFVQGILQTEKGDRTEKQTQQLTSYLEERDQVSVQLMKDLESVRKEIAALQPDSTLVMQELTEARMTQILKRGEFLSKGAVVEPKTPAALHSVPQSETQNRLALARWLVSPENPLVARVTVNRWWSEFFGQGIVSTLEDFGQQGERPTHPLLLDWLAVEFMNNGWSMKQLHKTIVMSATYQQASRVNNTHLKIDPDNTWYARGPRFRLSAEAIRDTALAISGLLGEKMHGPPVYPPQPSKVWRHVGRNAPVYETSTGVDRYRRGIYVIWRRSAPYPSFVNFDAPDRGACVIKRSRTNTPLQALTLLNDPAYVEIAIGFAKRLEKLGKENGSEVTDRDRVIHGMRLCVSRQPTKSEVDHLLQVFERERAYFENQLPQAQKLLKGEGEASDLAADRWAAWFYVANILLNLDETVTKG